MNNQTHLVELWLRDDLEEFVSNNPLTAEELTNHIKDLVNELALEKLDYGASLITDLLDSAIDNIEYDLLADIILNSTIAEE